MLKINANTFIGLHLEDDCENSALSDIYMLFDDTTDDALRTKIDASLDSFIERYAIDTDTPLNIEKAVYIRMERTGAKASIIIWIDNDHFCEDDYEKSRIEWNFDNKQINTLISCYASLFEYNLKKCFGTI